MKKTALIDNKNLYDKLWRKTKIREPSSYPEWIVLEEFVMQNGRFLEVGPGTRPRLPIEKTTYIDLSEAAVHKLNSVKKGCAILGALNELPFEDNAFDLVCAFDVVEHVEDDQRVFNEVGRVLAQSGRFVLSVPMHWKYYDRFDRNCGHCRRYEPEEIIQKLETSGLTIESVSQHGIRGSNRTANEISAFFLKRMPSALACVADVFYGQAQKRARKKIFLYHKNLLDHLKKMYAVMIVAQKTP